MARGPAGNHLLTRANFSVKEKDEASPACQSLAGIRFILRFVGGEGFSPGLTGPSSSALVSQS
jgi:hypothetical protein